MMPLYDTIVSDILLPLPQENLASGTACVHQSMKSNDQDQYHYQLKRHANGIVETPNRQVCLLFLFYIGSTPTSTYVLIASDQSRI